VTATRWPAPDTGREANLAALACLALFLIVGTWWPVLTDGGFPLPQRPVAWQGGSASGEASPPPVARTERAPSPRLDLNAADAAALEGLPGLGPVLARRIVAYREAHGPFRSPEELAQVSGLGEKRLARLRPLVRIGEGP
jgi:competence protein ComEA